MEGAMPIIIVPAAATATINMLNAKACHPAPDRTLTSLEYPLLLGTIHHELQQRNVWAAKCMKQSWHVSTAVPGAGHVPIPAAGS